ncbi:carboxymuconolactone decarboxylase family protein [Microlunatus soli]|uniref:4-carboxymuconolactone decarboxylase n=1 Tax=Microlunatus soli TaxID=630515 RepID=A0A1H1VKL7_9ACTN|nr:carboxymuconolactone decarboxylase family protein [Microlunatus soli]SDS85313.1 4-carboxymuconolactone decarboxylase [Microlunatus soli]
MTLTTPFIDTDPELVGWFDAFADGEVSEHDDLDRRTRLLCQLAALIACQADGAYRELLTAALPDDVAPVQIKEVVYQAVPYLGMAKVYDFLLATNEILTEHGIALPLPGQATTTPADRLESGADVQRKIVGADRFESLRTGGPTDLQHIPHLLSANCFGDHYTRTGLELDTRELITFSLLVAQGGCDPQVRGHVQGNLNVGNDRSMLINVVTQLLPLIGYPRTLNGIAAINDVAPAGTPAPHTKEK